MKRSNRTANLLAAALLTCLLATTGCRSLFDGLATWPVGDKDTAHDATLAPFQHDQWTQNIDWSPIGEFNGFPLESDQTSPFRWIHPPLQSALEATYQKRLFDQIRNDIGAPILPGGFRINVSPSTELEETLRELTQQNDMRGWNACILWAQVHPQAALAVESTLRRLVLNPPRYDPGRFTGGGSSQIGESKSDFTAKGSAARSARTVVISVNMQSAAAESWCRVLAFTREDPEEALAPAGRAVASGKVSPKIAQELIRGIARHVPPSRIPQLAESGFGPARSQASPEAAEARRSAMEACLLYAVHRVAATSPTANQSGAPATTSIDDDTAWPDGFWSCEHDPDARIRTRFLEFLAVQRHPDAARILHEKIHDQDQAVREAALVCLGLLGSDEAWAELRSQSKRQEERARVIAVRGLSFRGPAELRPFANDKSFRVRAEVARCLSRHPSQESARLLRDLQSDPNLEVQSAAVLACLHWPDELAVPLLLQSLAESSLRTRQTALDELENRRGGGLPFPLYASPQERALRAQQWAVEWKLPDSLVAAMRELSQPGNARIDAIRLAEIRERLATLPERADGAARDAETGAFLALLTPADVPLIEELMTQLTETQLDLVLHAALPRLSPAYESLARLETPELPARQAAATSLVRIAEAVSLSPMVLRRVHHLMKTEQDRLVWRSVLQAVQQDASEGAGQLALLAINNTWPDVRVLGCEYVGRHGQSEQATWLLPVLHDSSRLVQLAAIRAAGACGNPVVLDGLPGQSEKAGRGLRPLLSELQGPARFAVIQSMSRLGDQQAMEELTRLSFDVNPATRLDVVRTMGDTTQSRFVEPLIRLAWTEPDHHVRQGAVAALSKIVPADRHPAGLTRAKSLAEMVTLWNDWWTAQARAAEPPNTFGGAHERNVR